MNDEINYKTDLMKQCYFSFFMYRMCNVLADRSRLDEERMEKLMSELKDARLIAEDADAKSDEIARKLQFVEEELEAAEERVKTSEAYVLTIIIITLIIDI